MTVLFGLLMVVCQVIAPVQASAAQAAPATIAVVGHVQHPGIYDAPADKTFGLVQLLALGGGLLPDADATTVQLFRYGSVMVTVDVQRVIGGSRSDIVLKPGDVVYVPGLAKDHRIAD
jgi:protein involved in polysaccharide export with SLBB domain